MTKLLLKEMTCQVLLSSKTEEKTDAGKDWRQKEKEATKDEMVR